MEEFGETMKASGGKPGGTSPEEKTGAVPSVAKLPISPNGGRGELRALGGGKHDEGNQRLTAQLAGSLAALTGQMLRAEECGRDSKLASDALFRTTVEVDCHERTRSRMTTRRLA